MLLATLSPVWAAEEQKYVVPNDRIGTSELKKNLIEGGMSIYVPDTDPSSAISLINLTKKTPVNRGF